MKTGLFTLTLFIAGLAFSQTQGEIKYVTKINMHASLPDNENSEMIKAMIPEFQEMTNILLFTPSESIYMNEPEDEEAEDNVLEEEQGNVMIKIEMNEPEEIIYTDIANGIVIEQRDLMGKAFLIKDTLRQSDWRVTDEQQLFAGVSCQKAELILEQDTVYAWFTPQIPISTGPSGFGGLPGLIVHVSMQGGAFQITAADINKREIGKKEIKAPSKGKSITAKEFEELQKEKMKQMQEQYGGASGDGNVIMITN